MRLTNVCSAAPYLNSAPTEACVSDLYRIAFSGSLDGLKSFTDGFPNEAATKDGKGRLAIHYAVDENPDGSPIKGALKEVAKNVSQNPLGPSKQDGKGRLPLHVAALGLAYRPDILRLLLDSYRGGTNVRDKDGDLPIECALCNQNFKTAAFLLKNHLGDLDIKGSRMIDTLPLLHLAVKHGAPDSLLAGLIQKSPESLQFPDEDGDLPLHYAVQKLAPYDTILLLLEADTNAARTPNKKGALPLHLESKYGGRPEVLGLLDAANRGGIKTVCTKRGGLPMHYAVQNATSSLESLKLLHESFPKGLLVKSKHGNTPLQAVCYLQSEDDLCTRNAAWLLEKCPEAAQVPNDEGALALHVVAKYQPTCLKLLSMLISVYPNALAVGDEEGNTPLHSLFCSEEPVSVKKFKILLRKCPAAALKTRKDGKLPLHLACSREKGLVPLEIIDLLTESYPNGLMAFSKDGSLPIHCAALQARNMPLVSHIMNQHVMTLSLYCQQQMVCGACASAAFDTANDHVHAIKCE